MSNIHVDVHDAQLGRVSQLFPADRYPDRPDNERTVVLRIGDVALFFNNAVKAHDFGTDIHNAVEALEGWK